MDESHKELVAAKEYYKLEAIKAGSEARISNQYVKNMEMIISMKSLSDPNPWQEIAMRAASIERFKEKIVKAGIALSFLENTLDKIKNIEEQSDDN